MESDLITFIELLLIDETSENSLISLISIFHFDISGIIKSELHPLKIFFILTLFLNFHLEIGILDNNEQFSKVLSKSVIFRTFHF